MIYLQQKFCQNFTSCGSLRQFCFNVGVNNEQGDLRSVM